MRYYSTQRPIGPGSFPRSGQGAVEQIKNFDGRIFCKEIGRLAWGFIDFREPISPEEAAAYELVPAERRAVQR